MFIFLPDLIVQHLEDDRNHGQNYKNKIQVIIKQNYPEVTQCYPEEYYLLFTKSSVLLKKCFVFV